MNKQQCKKCKKNQKIICTNGLCYYCFTNKHKRPPTEKEYVGQDTSKARKR